jgi:hypothetical protein
MLKVISDVPTTEVDVDGICSVNHPLVDGYKTDSSKNCVVIGF